MKCYGYSHQFTIFHTVSFFPLRLSLFLFLFSRIHRFSLLRALLRTEELGGFNLLLSVYPSEYEARSRTHKKHAEQSLKNSKYFSEVASGLGLLSSREVMNNSPFSVNYVCFPFDLRFSQSLLAFASLTLFTRCGFIWKHLHKRAARDVGTQLSFPKSFTCQGRIESLNC